ncbi:hypothetical protein F3Y22_tig00113124pilonHSYRG00582 [Hibiscus syriacus]|uniref:ATP-dependent helicase C-terminal domain-containing protein n=1 Tax=Hibiscus syriacus TaxID=106335 RepID=A0A6A2Y0N6_HIBSY|nr:hypothetical protein F3Y22_tig00113124pilonHSYRG00582 [Hibiscus syriacus]
MKAKSKRKEEKPSTCTDRASLDHHRLSQQASSSRTPSSSLLLACQRRKAMTNRIGYPKSCLIHVRVSRGDSGPLGQLAMVQPRRLAEYPTRSGCSKLRPNIINYSSVWSPLGRSFDFSYDLRGSSTMVYDSWKTSGILERIMKRKHVFRELRKSTEIEAILKEYKETIDNPAPKSGAILLVVVGGKISEGINFNDGMG